MHYTYINDDLKLIPKMLTRLIKQAIIINFWANFNAFNLKKPRNFLMQQCLEGKK